MASVVSDIQLAPSITSIGTNSSGVSVGWMNVVEPAPSVANSDRNNIVAEGKNSPRWRKKFKARHIQMMALGIAHLHIKLTRRRWNRYRNFVPIWTSAVLCGTRASFAGVRFDGYCHIFCVGEFPVSCVQGNRYRMARWSLFYRFPGAILPLPIGL
jgi:hypothetical protein